MNPSAPLTSSGASKILNVTPEMVRLLNRQGKLDATRTESGVRLFQREDVERLAAERASRKREAKA